MTISPETLDRLIFGGLPDGTSETFISHPNRRPPMVDDNSSPAPPAGDRPITPSEAKKAAIAALLREREGYVLAGKTERVKAVDAALKALGQEHIETTVEKPVLERPEVARQRRA